MTTPRLLSERYELGEVLGFGGMSEVHRGLDTRLGRDVAVKVLRADLARDPAVPDAVPPRGAERGRAQPPRDRRRVRHRRGAERFRAAALHRHGVRRRPDPARDRQDHGPDEPAAGARRHGRRVRRAGLLAPPPDHPPRREARQHHDQPRGRGEGDGLRHRPRAGRGAERHADRRRHRHRAVPVARAGARRGGRRALATSTPRAACSTSCSPASRRSPATPRSRWPTSTCGRTRKSPSEVNPAVPPALDAIVLKALSQEPGQPLPVGRRDALGPRPRARRAGPARALRDERRRAHRDDGRGPAHRSHPPDQRPRRAPARAARLRRVLRRRGAAAAHRSGRRHRPRRAGGARPRRVRGLPAALRARHAVAGGGAGRGRAEPAGRVQPDHRGGPARRQRRAAGVGGRTGRQGDQHQPGRGHAGGGALQRRPHGRVRARLRQRARAPGHERRRRHRAAQEPGPRPRRSRPTRPRTTPPRSARSSTRAPARVCG